jgi:hypothetical protein
MEYLHHIRLVCQSVAVEMPPIPGVCIGDNTMKESYAIKVITLEPKKFGTAWYEDFPEPAVHEEPVRAVIVAISRKERLKTW